MEFPARVKIHDEPRVKDDREYWNNRIGTVLPCTDKEYAEIKGGGEIITDGPVRGDGRGKAAKSSARDAHSLPYDDTPVSDDVPF